MPLYLQKRPIEIPPPSESNWRKDDDEGDYLTDPDQARDRLPQPFRMIDKLISLLLEQSWEIIHAREEKREAERNRVKAVQYEPSTEIQISGTVNCIAGGGAGSCIFVGLSVGVAVFSLPDGSWICVWQSASIEICTICAIHLGNQIHVLGTVDDMGIARLFYFYKDGLFLIKAINETEDVSKRTICTHIEICQGGDYAGVLLEGGGDSWLELYRLPKDSWQKELDHSKTTPGIGSTSAAAALSVRQGTPSETPSGTQDAEVQETVVPGPSAEDIKLASPQLIMKIRPPRPVTGSSFKNLSEAVQKSDDHSVIGSGQNHVISAHQWEQQEAIFCSEFRRYLEVDTPEMRQDDKPSRAVFHFHMPCKVLQTGGDSKFQTGSPNSISVHWSGYQNLCLYLIARPTKTDVDPKPDVVWPCAAPVACSAVSSGSVYLALGFEDGCITLWDMKFSGCPLAVLALPGENFLQSIYFLESPKSVGDQTRDDSAPVNPRVQILVWCTDGSLYLVTAATGRETSTVLLIDSPQDSEDQLSAVTPVSSLPGTALLFFRTGVVQLMNCAERETIGQFAASPGFTLASPWQPVFTLDQENTCLIFRGDQRPSPGETDSREAASCSLFVFSLNSYPFMESFQMKEESAETSTQLLPLEKRCQMFLQSRLKSFEKRSKKQKECWDLLPKHAVEAKKINKARRKTPTCPVFASR